MKYNFVDPSDPILTTEMPRFKFASPTLDPVELSKDLIQMMYDNNGLGLAANQVGVEARMFVMRGGTEGDYAVFNPVITDQTTETVTLEEGCLSYPGLLVKIKRPKTIRVRFFAPDGEAVNETFTGLSARVFMHEMDHLDGIVHIDRANRYHRDKAMKDWMLYKRRSA